MKKTKQIIREFRKFLQQPVIKKSSFVFLALFTSSVLLLGYSWRKIPPEVPLYYSLPWGEKQLASPIELTLLPTLALSIFLTNFLLAFFLMKKDEVFLKITIFSSLFSSFLLSYCLLRIILLVV